MHFLERTETIATETGVYASRAVHTRSAALREERALHASALPVAMVTQARHLHAAGCHHITRLGELRQRHCAPVVSARL